MLHGQHIVNIPHTKYVRDESCNVTLTGPELLESKHHYNNDVKL